jgi:hypothetical protein
MNGKGYAITWASPTFDWPGDFANVSMVQSTFYSDGN